MEGDGFKNNTDFHIASDVSSALDADAIDLANAGKKAVLRVSARLHNAS